MRIRSFIYTKSNKNHSDRDIISAAWDNVAREVEASDGNILHECVANCWLGAQQNGMLSVHGFFFSSTSTTISTFVTSCTPFWLNSKNMCRQPLWPGPLCMLSRTWTAVHGCAAYGWVQVHYACSHTEMEDYLFSTLNLSDTYTITLMFACQFTLSWGDLVWLKDIQI